MKEMQEMKNDKIICLYFRIGGPYIVTRLRKRIASKNTLNFDSIPTIKKSDLRSWRPIGSLLEYYKCMRRSKS